MKREPLCPLLLFLFTRAVYLRVKELSSVFRQPTLLRIYASRQVIGRELLAASAYRSGTGGAHVLSRVLHCAYNILVASTAADVALQPFANLGLAGVGVIFEQLVGSHNHARGAEAALQAMFLPEAFLNGMQFAFRGQSFNRGNIAAIGLNSQHSTRFDRFTIQLNNTRTTL
jgi:hypothetical protein